MHLSDFRRYFDKVDVLHMDAGWAHFRAQGRLTARRAVLTFEVAEACRGRVAVYQRRRGAGGASYGWRVSVVDAATGSFGPALFPAGMSAADCATRSYLRELSITTPELSLVPSKTYGVVIEGYPPSAGLLPLDFAVLGSVSSGKLVWGSLI